MHDISVVIATSALAQGADTQPSSAGVPYGERAWLLRSIILPAYTRYFAERFREIVVVGEWEPGEGYTYVPFPSVYRNCADALLKRQVGYDSLRKQTSWVLFQHDDHLWDPTNLVDPREPNYVLSPSRWVRHPMLQAQNDGFLRSFADDGWRSLKLASPDESYVNGHVCLMKPHIFRDGFKWTDAPPTFTWDVSVTARLRELNVPIRYAPELRTWDMERS